mmetsp:Transcript_43023/g.111233  ORF Transcript_43023/g.111233 Transcript_43023/m.111233 type:complete len:437 (-) Transcript_43023:2528-3838(-)
MLVSVVMAGSSSERKSRTGQLTTPSQEAPLPSSESAFLSKDPSSLCSPMPSYLPLAPLARVNEQGEGVFYQVHTMVVPDATQLTEEMRSRFPPSCRESFPVQSEDLVHWDATAPRSMEEMVSRSIPKRRNKEEEARADRDPSPGNASGSPVPTELSSPPSWTCLQFSFDPQRDWDAGTGKRTHLSLPLFHFLQAPPGSAGGAPPQLRLRWEEWLWRPPLFMQCSVRADSRTSEFVIFDRVEMVKAVLRYIGWGGKEVSSTPDQVFDRSSILLLDELLKKGVLGGWDRDNASFSRWKLEPRSRGRDLVPTKRAKDRQDQKRGEGEGKERKERKERGEERERRALDMDVEHVHAWEAPSSVCSFRQPPSKDKVCISHFQAWTRVMEQEKSGSFSSQELFGSSPPSFRQAAVRVPWDAVMSACKSKYQFPGKKNKSCKY